MSQFATFALVTAACGATCLAWDIWTGTAFWQQPKGTAITDMDEYRDALERAGQLPDESDLFDAIAAGDVRILPDAELLATLTAGDLDGWADTELDPIPADVAVWMSDTCNALGID